MATIDLSGSTKFKTDDVKSAFVEVTTTRSVITLNPDRAYTFYHTGLDASAVAQTVPIYLTEGAAFTETPAQAADRWIVLNNGSVVVGPGVTTINASIGGSGSEDPVMGVIAGPTTSGQGW